MIYYTVLPAGPLDLFYCEATEYYFLKNIIKYTHLTSILLKLKKVMKLLLILFKLLKNNSCLKILNYISDRQRKSLEKD